MWKLSKTAHKAVTIISLFTEVLMNLLSDTKGASQALTHHLWLIVSHALLSGLLKHLGSIELLLELKLFFHISCSKPVWASRPGSPNPVLNIHETYLPHCYHLICPPEAHQPPSLGQHSLIHPQEVHLTPSLGLFTCPHSSLTCVPAVLWHQPLSLGLHLLIHPQEVHLTPSSDQFTCPHSSLACMPAVPWHHPLAWLEVTLQLMMARACSICWVQCLMFSMAEESDQSSHSGQ